MLRAEASPSSALRARRRAAISSKVFASHTVQVMTDASTRQISTPFTNGSADRYMPHGVRSRGSSAAAEIAAAGASVAVWAYAARDASKASSTKLKTQAAARLQRRNRRGISKGMG